MAEVINLRRARKAMARSQKEEQAAQNRLLFGLSKAERTANAKLREKGKRQLDAHQLVSSRSLDDGEAT